MNKELQHWLDGEKALRSRRQFLMSAAGVAGLGALGSFGFSLNSMAAASTLATSALPTDYKAMVCFFMYGGNDNANTLIPYDQATYNSYVMGREGSLSRPLGVTRLREDLLPLATPSMQDGRQLGLPWEMSRLKSLYDRGKVAIVPNVGVLANPTSRAQYESKTIELPPQLFSHSDQQRFWQLGVPSYSTLTGWAGRMGDLLAAANQSAAVSMCVSLNGNNAWQVGNSVLPYPINAETGASEFWSFWDSNRRNAMNALNADARTGNMLQRQASRVYNRSVGAQELMRTSLAAGQGFDDLFTGVPSDLNPGLVEDYMHVQESFRMVARMVDARERLGHRRQIFFVSLGGFDDHDSLADHGDRLRIVADHMAAFYAATERMGIQDNVVTFTGSDFGRTLRSNGSGSDHGWGSHHFAMGGSVLGGDLYGRFPSLEIGGPDAVEAQGQLLPSTSVDEYAATLAKWYGVSSSDIPLVIPNVGRFARPDLGFMRPV
jgi:uncharacterized protein (DUF1501 family)